MIDATARTREFTAAPPYSTEKNDPNQGARRRRICAGGGGGQPKKWVKAITYSCEASKSFELDRSIPGGGHCWR